MPAVRSCNDHGVNGRIIQHSTEIVRNRRSAAGGVFNRGCGEIEHFVVHITQCGTPQVRPIFQSANVAVAHAAQANHGDLDLAVNR